jgi:hypothetical protein
MEMKIITIIAITALLCSCSRQVIKPVPKNFESYVTISYGDERFHSCEELIDVTYGITETNDTFRVKVSPRYNCKTYNYRTWKD